MIDKSLFNKLYRFAYYNDFKSFVETKSKIYQSISVNYTHQNVYVTPNDNVSNVSNLTPGDQITKQKLLLNNALVSCYEKASFNGNIQRYIYDTLRLSSELGISSQSSAFFWRIQLIQLVLNGASDNFLLENIERFKEQYDKQIVYYGHLINFDFNPHWVLLKAAVLTDDINVVSRISQLVVPSDLFVMNYEAYKDLSPSDMHCLNLIYFAVQSKKYKVLESLCIYDSPFKDNPEKWLWIDVSRHKKDFLTMIFMYARYYNDLQVTRFFGEVFKSYPDQNWLDVDRDFFENGAGGIFFENVLNYEQLYPHLQALLVLKYDDGQHLFQFDVPLLELVSPFDTDPFLESSDDDGCFAMLEIISSGSVARKDILWAYVLLMKKMHLQLTRIKEDAAKGLNQHSNFHLKLNAGLIRLFDQYLKLEGFSTEQKLTESYREGDKSVFIELLRYYCLYALDDILIVLPQIIRKLIDGQYWGVLSRTIELDSKAFFLKKEMNSSGDFHILSPDLIDSLLNRIFNFMFKNEYMENKVSEIESLVQNVLQHQNFAPRYSQLRFLESKGYKSLNYNVSDYSLFRFSESLRKFLRVYLGSKDLTILALLNGLSVKIAHLAYCGNQEKQDQIDALQLAIKRTYLVEVSLFLQGLRKGFKHSQNSTYVGIPDEVSFKILSFLYEGIDARAQYAFLAEQNLATNLVRCSTKTADEKIKEEEDNVQALDLLQYRP